MVEHQPGSGERPAIGLPAILQKIAALLHHVEGLYEIRLERRAREELPQPFGVTHDPDLGDLRDSLENQTRLDKDWSVPPQGLFLSEIKYEFLLT